jgi:glycosyltransferase involved in cell wall biosynthesis
MDALIEVSKKEILQMEKKNALVSIIVRTKDRPKLLKSALQSIADQTYGPIEVVLVNDGGCDLDIEELKGILGDIALNYIRLEKNTGRANAGNVGIENAKGHYMGFLDDDDEFYPEHLGTLVSFLEHNDYEVAYTDSLMVYKGYDPHTHEFNNEVKKEIAFSQDFNYDRLVFENYIPLMCLLFDRRPLVNSGGFEKSFDLYEDWDLLIRIGNKYPFYHIRQITSNYNQWSIDLQISQRNNDPIFLQQAYLKVLSRHIKEITPRRIHGIISEYVHNRQSLKELRDESESHKNLMREKDSQISTLDSQINILSAELREKGSQIDALAAEVREREAQISTLDFQINILSAELQEKGSQIDALNSEMKERDSRLSPLTSVIGEKEAEVVALRIAVQERDALVSAMRNTLGWRMLEKYRRMRDSVRRRKSSE